MSQGSRTSVSKSRWSKKKSSRPPASSAELAQLGVLEALETRTLLSTYYVSPSGSDSAAGGSSAPWKTLQKAADNAKAGDIVRVGAGTYTSGMNFFGKTGGTAAAPIQFLADSGAVITHAATVGTNASLAGINVENTGGYYVFKGFTINSDGSMQRAGIRVSTSSNVQLINNTVDRAFIGIFTSSSSNLLIQGNTCRNSTDQHGIYVGAGNRNSTVRGNTLYGNNWDGLHLNASNAIGPNDGTLVEDNVIYGNTLSGVDAEGITNAVFRNNLIYKNTKHGISVHSQDQTRAGNPTPVSQNNTFVNNTMTGNGLFGLVFQPEDMGGTVIFNNVLQSASTGNYGAIGVSGSANGITSDYNIVDDKFSTNLGSGKMTLAQWRSTTGQDAHSVVATPGQTFVNYSGNDFHLVSSSAAIDRGVASLGGRNAPTDDFAQAARPQGAGYDVGAYEYGAATPPADTTAPTISGVGSSNLTTGGATVSWTTNEASDTQVEYGTTTSYGSSTALNSALVTSHSAGLSGLAAGTTYHYRVKSRDAAGNLATSGDLTLTTAQAADTTAPTITGVGSSNVSSGAASVTWTTNEASDSQVEFGTSTAYGSSTALDGTDVTSHSATLTGLTASTVYHFRVKSRDAAGNLAVSGDFTFTTAAVADTTAPVISGVSTTNVTSSGVTANWITNEASDTLVEYGTTTSYGNSTTLNASKVTSHSAGVSGLLAGTTYHYRVKSRDAAGNLAVSGDYTFTTAAAPVSTTVFSSSNEGDFADYTPLTASRWSVTQDGGDARLYLNTTNYSELSGDRLGEYALAGGQSYGDFDMTLKARTGENLTSNKMADYAIVFGFVDANNYSYAMLNSGATSSAIFDVVNGVRQQVASSTTAAFTDAAYHNVQVSRRGQVVSVSVDGRQVLSANNAGVATAGRVGVGSFNDCAYFDDVNVTVPVVAPPTQFSATANQGDFSTYAPLTASRWSVAQDGGDTRLFLNTSNYSELSGDRLGEYALVGGKTYGDFDLTLSARTAEDVAANRMADYAVVFGFADANNYSYVMLNADAASTQLFTVTNGTRQLVATATAAGIPDAAYHNVRVTRTGQSVNVSVDGASILSASAASIGGVGQVGLGSFNDSAYFDDVNVSVPAAAAAAAPAASPFSATRVTTSSVLDPTTSGVLA